MFRFYLISSILYFAFLFFLRSFIFYVLLPSSIFYLLCILFSFSLSFFPSFCLSLFFSFSLSLFLSFSLSFFISFSLYLFLYFSLSLSFSRSPNQHSMVDLILELCRSNAIASWTIPWAAQEKHCHFKRAGEQCGCAGGPHRRMNQMPTCQCPTSNGTSNGSPCKCPGQAPENQDAIALRSKANLSYMFLSSSSFGLLSSMSSFQVNSK